MTSPPLEATDRYDDTAGSARPLTLERVGLWSKIVSHVFFCFFTSPIFSPSIGDLAFYLHWVVPLLDPAFLRYLHRSALRLDAETIAVTAACLLWFGFVAPQSALRLILILWPLTYLRFTYESEIFYLYTWVCVNVIAAVAQAVTYYVAGRGMALLIGPKNIAKTIWGPYATPSFSNFYSILPGIDFPRFAGFSREGGFFAALLAVVFLIRKVEKQAIGAMLLLGIALSISKVTVFLAAGWLVVLVGQRDRRSPTILFLPFFVAFVLVYYLFIDSSLLSGQLSSTFTQRFYGYTALIHDMDLPNLLVGNKASSITLVQFQAFQLCARMESYRNCLETPTFAALILNGGVVGLSLYLWQLSVIGIKLWGVILLFVLTSNVSPLTTTSFVVLSYFLAIQICSQATLKPSA